MSIKLIATDDMGRNLFADDHTYVIILYSRKVFRQRTPYNIYFVAARWIPVFHLVCGLRRISKTTPPRWDLFCKMVQLFIWEANYLNLFPINQESLARVIHVLDRFYGPQDINQLVISTSEKSYVDQGMSAHDFQYCETFMKMWAHS